MKTIKVAEAIIHHHEHLLGVTSGAEDEDTVIIRGATLIERRHFSVYCSAATPDDSDMKSLDFVSIGV
jgi:hypothetical protein